MDVDEFMRAELSSSEEGRAVSTDKSPDVVKRKKKKQLRKKSTIAKTLTNGKLVKTGKKVKQAKATESDNSDAEDSSSHKAALAKLQQSDPEFYKFLAQEDAELLDFNISSESEDEDDKTVHTLPGELEVASDDSEFEFDPSSTGLESSEGKKKKQKLPQKITFEESDEQDAGEAGVPAKKGSGSGTQITLKTVKRWDEALKANATIPVFQDVVSGFQAAVARAAGTDVEGVRYLVEDATVFDAVMRCCLSRLGHALHSLLKKPVPSKKSKQKGAIKEMFSGKSSKIWKKLKPTVRTYLVTLIKLLGEVDDESILGAALRHTCEMVPYCAHFAKLSKSLLKRLIRIWSTQEESCRVLALLGIVRLVESSRELLMEIAIKNMYLSYVQNTRLVSVETWPVILFMQRSYAEICGLDQELTYQHAFVYIRQLAIHLRNAINAKKKEQMQTVCNWQFVQSLYLWARVVAILHPSPSLRPLLYPLIQVVVGCADLVSGARHAPLRFHCAHILLVLVDATGVFVPILPLVLQVLASVNFAKLKSQPSFKPLNFDCLLKLSKSQMKEASFKDGVIEHAVDLIMETAHCHSASISFPELFAPCEVQLRRFMKQCKSSSYNRQLKTALDRIGEHSRWVEDRRKECHCLCLSDQSTVDSLQRSLKVDNPFDKFYSSWKKLREREMLHRISQKNEINEVDVQKVPRAVNAKRRTNGSATKSFTQIMEDSTSESSEHGSDSEPDSSEDEPRRKRKLTKFDSPKPNRKGVATKKKNTQTQENEDNDATSAALRAIHSGEVAFSDDIAQLGGDEVGDLVLSDSD